MLYYSQHPRNNKALKIHFTDARTQGVFFTRTHGVFFTRTQGVFFTRIQSVIFKRSQDIFSSWIQGVFSDRIFFQTDRLARSGIYLPILPTTSPQSEITHLRRSDMEKNSNPGLLLLSSSPPHQTLLHIVIKKILAKYTLKLINTWTAQSIL